MGQHRFEIIARQREIEPQYGLLKLLKKIKPANFLRSWLESNIEIVARDKKEQVVEKLPLTLDSTDLQSYCHQLMDEFRENRVYSSEALSLEFRYKEAA